MSMIYNKGLIVMRKWLVICYTLPTESSRIRVAAWRGLKKQGTVNIQKSMWVLPYSEENYTALSGLSEDLENSHGEIIIMESVLEELNKLLSWFNKIQVRDIFDAPLRMEMAEALEKCKKIFEEFSSKLFDKETRKNASLNFPWDLFSLARCVVTSNRENHTLRLFGQASKGVII